MKRSVCFLAAGVFFMQTLVTAQSLDFQFFRTRVEPIFLRVREASGPGGSCFMSHTHVVTRFRLQPPSQSLSWTEEQSRKNFEAVSRLVVSGDPLKSRLLTHPLATAAATPM